MQQLFTQVITGTSPSAASTTAALATVARGLRNYDWFTIDAIIIGGTGGTIDVTLQRKIQDLSSGTAVDLWVDWLHFPQVAAAATKKYTASSGSNTTIVEVGMQAALPGTTAETLAVNTFVGGHPGNELRALCRSGAGNSAGAVQTIYVSAWRSSKS